MTDATDAGVTRGATVPVAKRGGQHRRSSHHGKAEDEDSRELHGRTAKSVKQQDERSKMGGNLSRRWGFE